LVYSTVIDLIGYTFVMPDVMEEIKNVEKDNLEICDYLLNQVCPEKEDQPQLGVGQRYKSQRNSSE